jgi:hypothetical protein
VVPGSNINECSGIAARNMNTTHHKELIKALLYERTAITMHFGFCRSIRNMNTVQVETGGQREL